MASPSQPRAETPLYDFLDLEGEMAKRFRDFDWTSNSLGPIELWSSSALTMVGVMLASPFPMTLYWGSDHIILYNDAYIEIAGHRHPQLLGKSARLGFSDIWSSIQPMIETALLGKATWFRNQLLFMNRNNFLEECHFTTSYTPVRNFQGHIEGISCPVTETTEQVVNDRNLALLREIGLKTEHVRKVDDVFSTLSEVLSRFLECLPFSLTYLFDDDQKLYLKSFSGFRPYTDLFSLKRDISEFQATQSANYQAFLERLCVQDSFQVLDSNLLTSFLGTLPSAPWPVQSREAVVFVFSFKVNSNSKGLLILGMNPCRPFSDKSKSFLDLLLAQILRALVTAYDFESTKRNADAMTDLAHAKSVFFSNISHELRTPLTLMIGPLEDSLSDKLMSVSQLQRQRLVYRNSLRLLKLVNSLLDFSRIQAGRMTASLQPTRLDILTVDLASTFQSLMDKAGLEYNINVTPHSAQVYIDPQLYEKILFNLLSNAFKFTLAGSISVTLSYKQDFIELEVKDTGIGIASADFSRLFVRFNRLDSSKGRSYEGTGIGLALVSEAVNLHRGSVRVESTPGVGTSFFVTLPLGYDNLNENSIVSSESYTAGGSSTSFLEEAYGWLNTTDTSDAASVVSLDSASSSNSFIRHIAPQSTEKILVPILKTSSPLDLVLVVDDNADMRKYLASLLSPFYEVVLAVDGEDGLTTALKNPPQLIISDVMMPKMDGFQLIKHLKTYDATCNIPVIIVSARAGEEARNDGLLEGADDYLVKPFSSKELLTRVKSLIELSKLRSHLEDEVKLRTEEAQLSLQALEKETSENIRAKAELRAQRAEAQLADEYKVKQEEFIDTLCHEMRNPLNGLYGTVGLLCDKFAELEKIVTQEDGSNGSNELSTSLKLRQLINDLREDTETITSCAQQQKVIIDDVLDLSKLTNNKVDLNIQPCHMDALIRKVTQLFSALMRQKNLQLYVFLPQNPLWCYVDSNRLSQMIINLLSNSVKFTSSGSISVQVTYKEPESLSTSPQSRSLTNSCLNSVSSQGILTCSVKDTGVGMTPDEVGRLYERFAQANRRISSDYGGSGLGLALTKKLAVLMGGKLEVNTEKGRGSEFSIIIPCDKLSPAQQSIAEMEHLASTQPLPVLAMVPVSVLQNLRILIVEDNVVNQKLLMNYLSIKHYNYSLATNGQEAYDTYVAEKFDIIFMDIQMPIMDGLEATRKIRQHEMGTGRRSIIIGLTGDSSSERKRLSLAAGMDAYVTKPYERKRIYELVAFYAQDSSSPLLRNRPMTQIEKQVSIPES